MQNIRGEVRLPTRDVPGDIAFFTKRLGFRLEKIFPADDPRVAVISGHGIRVRLDAGSDATPGMVAILADDPVLIAGGETDLVSPGGSTVVVERLDPPVIVPQTAHALVVRRLADNAPWVVGRAGMHYRDLIPDRLGGSIIASHIRIPGGGPVPDMVHYHSIGFQLIFCYRGWVDLVYEDQGEPFRLHAGNCVIQPPEIRHRVLFASPDIEVIEIGVPAEHVTTIDHDLELPNGVGDPERRWEGQKFVHHRAEDAEWGAFRLSGYRSRDTTIAANTAGVATVEVVRRGDGVPRPAKHDADILFGFVMSGGLTLFAQGSEDRPLVAGDAFVIPPGLPTLWGDPTEDVEILEVALPGDFTTETV